MAIGRAALKAPWIFDDIRRLRRGEAVCERLLPERVALLYDLLYELIEKQENSKKNATQPTPPNI